MLIWNLIGWPCLIGVVLLLVAQALNALIARIILKFERVRRVATDDKLQVTTQFVEAIRHLRWYAWQNAWLSRILSARQQELNLRVITGLCGLMIAFINMLAYGMFPVVAFWAYAKLLDEPLRIEITFPALQLFSMLEYNLREIPGLVQVLLNAYIAVGRIEDFMKEPDRDEIDSTLAAGDVMKLREASFTWPGSSKNVLQHVSLSFPTGLTVIYGKVGSGKTALLQALLGELDKLDGDFSRPDEMFGYCAQIPWLQSMSIRENILFSSPYDDNRYKQVLAACALTPDLATFRHGDLSNIGENGIGLSGGQKARVALARAMYSRARILLLDDPISGLDHQTAEIVVKRCLTGPLAVGRTIVFTTHRTELCSVHADQVVEVLDETAHIVQLVKTPTLKHQLSSSHDPAEETDKKRTEAQEDAAIPEKFIEDEHRASGSVKLRVYWEYIKAGKLRWWAILVCVLMLYRLLDYGKTWFLEVWGESYSHYEASVNIKNPVDRFPSPDANVNPWLIAFLVIALMQTVVFLISRIFMIVIVYSAGQQMFKDIMQRVSHATFRYYDVTPVGRLMNRLTSDIGTIDGNISEQFQNVAFLAIAWVSSLAVIASVTPSFLVFSFALTAGFVLIFWRFLPTSQSLRRLEMVSLSPLISNFGALVDGLTTVRAFCAQHRFQDRVIEVTDAFQKMDHFYWTLQEWLMYRFDALSACSTFILTLLAIYTGVSPGLTAFVLVAASKFVDATHMLCKQYGQLQMDFVSVERVVELLHVEQEPPGTISAPAWWPTFSGDIVFENVTIRYAPHLDPALSNVSLRLKAGSKTAVVGRTGMSQAPNIALNDIKRKK